MATKSNPAFNVALDIDECASEPCQHNATCADVVAGYNCTCDAGYTGLQCETGLHGSLCVCYFRHQ